MQATPETRREHTGPENEIRVSFKTDVLRAVERAAAAFKNHEVVKFSAINTGISKLILIVEITKIKIEGLHQLNHLETLSKERVDNEGKQRTSYLTAFKVELWNTKPNNVPAGYIYQAPYTKEHIEAVKSVNSEPREEGDQRGGRRGRGRGRGGFRGSRGGFRGGRKTSTDSQGQGEMGSRGRGRGRGRGGFRGGRGSRGGFEGQRGGFEGQRGGRGGFEGRRGGYEGSRGGYEGSRGGFEGRRGGYEGSRGGFEGSRGGFEGGRGSRGGRGRGRGGFQQQQQQATPQAVPVERTNTIPGLGNRGPRTSPKN
jgi:hypothetical protein